MVAVAVAVHTKNQLSLLDNRFKQWSIDLVWYHLTQTIPTIYDYPQYLRGLRLNANDSSPKMGRFYDYRLRLSTVELGV